MSDPTALSAKLAKHFAMDILAQAKKFGVEPTTGLIGCRKPLTLHDLSLIVQGAVKKALTAYQEVLDGQGGEGEVPGAITAG